MPAQSKKHNLERLKKQVKLSKFCPFVQKSTLFSQKR
ncbi:MAG: 50S ribosomal protein L33 [Fibrobacter sp.]|nr:50S ribosomal protein L33 [Fibrobacter sp.]MBO7105822.1 50S ribosomal protein L33 [Fibrobacter sp.]MBR3669453.1 50S ribosomal protein L33 [Fibrobacter sp.]